MAKGKGGSATKYVSKGIHSNVARSTLNALRSDYMKSGDRLLNQRRAFDAGKRVMVTIENPNKNETNKRFIRVEARTVWKSNQI